ncbi:helix-turn-helix domain-containing protein [Saccharopolyspora spinosa]|uniref:Helix-turn-helix protein n=1 Tax=Saccharopolyspora spinosa TaxID=60894 RepID=A0A2N3Y7J7_SACSN|nr:helix-turn-helix transcriptional regulator [Saccharopolyspora spinosa]PKW18899.1 helix-turn-helix protein [Saccharopolyspora spinosa]
MSELEHRRAAFGERLRQLREAAGFPSGKRFADHCGWPQSKVSRIETGAQLASDADLTTWTEATGADESVASELRAELREIRLAAASWKRQLRHGNAARQVVAADLETQAQVIRVVETALVPGLLQTADYARHVFALNAEFMGTLADVEESVRARIARQQVLYDSSKEIEILVTEAALRSPVCPPDVMAGQLDRLATLLELSTFRLGIVPLDVCLPVIPLHGFWILDDQVLIETVNTEIIVTDPAEIDQYRRQADALWTVAAEGNEARALLARLPR